MTEVRGLPLSDFEIECEGQPFRILKKGGRCGVLVGRFVLLSSYRETICSAELRISLLRSPLGKIKVCEVGTLGEFCDKVLPELTLSRDGEDIIGSVAFEKKESKFYAISHFCRAQGGAEALITVIAVASYLYSSGFCGELSVSARGMFFDTVLSEYGLLVFDRHSRAITLYAPDIE